MGMLDKAGLDALIAAGCTACGHSRLVFRMYVDALLPLMGGEPVGKLKWSYNGEGFCDGVFEVTCDHCHATLFSDGVCPRCHAAEGLAKGLESENDYEAPLMCPSCEGEEVRFIAFVPARTVYEGKRAEKARTDVDLHDPGFHGYRVDCKTCGTVSELVSRCPICAHPAPIRDRLKD